jgi:hypothetical protein
MHHDQGWLIGHPAGLDIPSSAQTVIAGIGRGIQHLHRQSPPAAISTRWVWAQQGLQAFPLGEGQHLL